MSLYHDIRNWIESKRVKNITADEAAENCSSERAWKYIMYLIQSMSKAGETSVHHISVSRFQDKLKALGFRVNAKDNEVLWDKPLTIEDIDKRISELTELRDELKKEDLVKQLSGVQDIWKK